MCDNSTLFQGAKSVERNSEKRLILIQSVKKSIEKDVEKR